MASYVQNIIDAGANIIGGCCGTTPAHISKLKGMIKL
jgi:5-methyltetrahydrofolate--homocysteine methyltransferase